MFSVSVGVFVNFCVNLKFDFSEKCCITITYKFLHLRVAGTSLAPTHKLAERLEAFRRRNRGSRQRARENQCCYCAAASSGGRLSALNAVAEPVVDPPAGPANMEEEDWGASSASWVGIRIEIGIGT